jgi:hypothetical protein
VSGHILARDIIGEGIVKFEGRFLNSVEPHAGKLVPQLGALAAHRFDFIAHRIDGSAVRLHPGSGKDSKVIIGRMDDWCLHAAVGARASTPGSGYSSSAVGARASTPGSGYSSSAVGARVSTPDSGYSSSAPKDGAIMFKGLGRVDVMGNKQAVARALELRGPTENVDTATWDSWSVDLMHDDQFPWDRWLLARPWGRRIVDEKLTHMRLIWNAVNENFLVQVGTQSVPAPRDIRLTYESSRLLS